MGCSLKINQLPNGKFRATVGSDIREFTEWFTAAKWAISTAYGLPKFPEDYKEIYQNE